MEDSPGHPLGNFYSPVNLTAFFLCSSLSVHPDRVLLMLLLLPTYLQTTDTTLPVLLPSSPQLATTIKGVALGTLPTVHLHTFVHHHHPVTRPFDDQ